MYRISSIASILTVLVFSSASLGSFSQIPSNGSAGLNELHVPSEYPTIQAAIDAAVDGDTVIVAPGTYTGDGNRDLDFLGKAITVRSTDPNDPNIVAATVIDCNGSESERHRGFYFHNNEDANSVLDGFTITNGYASYGGAICCNSSSPALNNCIFNNNSAVGYGGGMDNSDSSPTINNCTFSGNSALIGGGGLSCYSGNPTIADCSFIENYSEEDGGGIYNTFSNLMIINSIFTENVAEKYGCGGILNYESSLVISNCIFFRNSAGSIYGSGGAILNFDCNSIITNSSIIENTAMDGGGVLNVGGNLTLTGCIFSGNSAGYDGGGLRNEDSNSVVTNCTFSGNSAVNNGGGMENAWSSTKLTNCTFTGNSAGYDGGGMDAYDSTITAGNCIFWDDVPQEIYLWGGSTVTVSCSDVKGGWPGIGNIDIDPCFVDADANDYHLKSAGWHWDIQRKVWTWDDVTSRCIDAGNPGSALADELLSIPDDPNNEWGQNLRINMGAFGGTAEASIPPYDWALLSDITNDGISGLDDLDILSSLWLNTGQQLYADFNRDGIIDLFDFTLLAQDWLEQTSWH